MKSRMTRRSWVRTSFTTLASFVAATSLPAFAGKMSVADNGLSGAKKGAAAKTASKVWMTQEISPEALVKIYEAMGPVFWHLPILSLWIRLALIWFMPLSRSRGMTTGLWLNVSKANMAVIRWTMPNRLAWGPNRMN